MFNLICKDVVIQKKSIVGCILFIIFYNILALFSKGYSGIFIYAGLPLVIEYLLLTNTFLFDDKNKSYVILNSLPIGRKNIVISRYLSVFVFFIVAISSQFILSTLVNRHITMKIDYVIADFIIVNIMSAVCLPLYFKYRYTKLKYFFMMFFFAFWFGVPYVVEKIDIVKLVGIFKGISYLGLYTISISCAIALIIISLTISIVIYNNREF